MRILPKKEKKEPLKLNTNAKLNWLRAGVLGANDGIVSIAGLVMGVAGATSDTHIILTSGIAGIIAGAISMAAGEYVSVSSSRDTERALIRQERYNLENFPDEELEELARIYHQKGMSQRTAMQAAKELTAKDPYAAHFDAELGIDPHNLTSPWHAAFASASAFLVGAIIPLIAIILPHTSYRIAVTVISVLIALALTGTISAKIGGASVKRAIFRVVAGGMLAMAITYGVGRLFNVEGI